MKKIILISFLSVLFLSCKSTNSATSTKIDSQSQTAIKGEWVISSVNYPGS